MKNSENKHLIIIMGVSGCGKSTVAHKLAKTLKGEFIEADDFHSEQNKKMMQSGVALTDALREPWINKLCAHIQNSQSSLIIMAYSGLRRSHRQRFRALGYITLFIWLNGSQVQIAERLHNRDGHFMSEVLLGSQFESLQLPENEVDIFEINISMAPEMLMDSVRHIIKNRLYCAIK